jgi:xanthine dehydrogenase YagT iron-sulfur-binding subunit
MPSDSRKLLGTSRRRFLGQALTAAGTAIVAPKMLDHNSVAEAQQSPVDHHSPIRGETPVTLVINGQPHQVNIEPRVTLLDVLRERLKLTGTKKGCDHGQCGACTVLVDGERIYSCLSLAIMQEGRSITTIEGLAKGEQLHPVQTAFIENDGFQCGYCTPGQICASVALLEEVGRGCASAVTADLSNPPKRATLSEAEIKERLSGNLCRCSAYNGIVAAVQQVAGQTPPSPAATILVQEVAG